MIMGKIHLFHAVFVSLSGKTNMKKKIEEQPAQSDSSTVIFTNLMILLLAFFIVLVTLASTDQRKKMAALNSLFGSFGLQAGGQSAIGDNNSMDITMPDSPINKEDVYIETLQNIASANGLRSDVEIRATPNKIVITLGERILFTKGHSTIPRENDEFLLEISKFLMDSKGLIELRGYADERETLLEPDPVRAALYLSAKRAMSVLHFLTEKGMIPASRLVAHGFGVPPASEKGIQRGKREWQGKVDVIVGYKEEIPYRWRVKRHWDRVLDFKGFLFKTHGSTDE
jgi:chemotaxis protein MotB